MSGSRAAAYCFKGLDVGDSDWDFFITYDMKNIIAMARYLRDCQGARWERLKTGLGINLKHKSRDLKIQLVYWDQKSAMDCVIDFHSSIVQCVITGFAAISLYRETGKGMSYYWRDNSVVGGNKNPGGTKSKALPSCRDSCVSPCVDKYKDRGVTYKPRDIE